MKFLVEENSFDKVRAERLVKRLQESKTKTKQKPLSRFFGAPKVVVTESDKFDPTKRKGAAKPKAGDNKRKATGPQGGTAKRGKA